MSENTQNVLNNIIDLKKLELNQPVDGIILLKDYAPKTDSASKAPLYGEAHFQGRTMRVKVWDKEIQHYLNHNVATFKNKTFHIKGRVTEYNGSLEVQADLLVKTDEDISPMYFHKGVEVKKVFDEFWWFLNEKGSQKVANLVNKVFAEENIWGLFQTTWAGAKFHDAQVGGLMNHTLKMLKILDTIIINDKRLEPYREKLMMGITFHDVGKVYEMGEGGVYTPNSFVTHRSLGVEIITRHKQSILEAYDERTFYDMMAIIQGHHGEFGEKPTTLLTKIVHLIDMLDCHVTNICDTVENNELKEYHGQKGIWENGGFLVL